MIFIIFNLLNLKKYSRLFKRVELYIIYGHSLKKKLKDKILWQDKNKRRLILQIAFSSWDLIVNFFRRNLTLSTNHLNLQERRNHSE